MDSLDEILSSITRLVEIKPVWGYLTQVAGGAFRWVIKGATGGFGYAEVPESLRGWVAKVEQVLACKAKGQLLPKEVYQVLSGRKTNQWQAVRAEGLEVRYRVYQLGAIDQAADDVVREIELSDRFMRRIRADQIEARKIAQQVKLASSNHTQQQAASEFDRQAEALRKGADYPSIQI